MLSKFVHSLFKSTGDFMTMWHIDAAKEQFKIAIDKHGEPTIASKNGLDYIFHYGTFDILIWWDEEQIEYRQIKFKPLT